MLQIGGVIGDSAGQDQCISAVTQAMVYSVQGQGCLYHLPVRSDEQAD